MAPPPPTPLPPIKRLYKNHRAHVIWTDDELNKLEKRASPEVMWAARLAAVTALRQADLLDLSWGHVGSLAIEVATRRSGGKVTKRPWRTGFGPSWQMAVQAAGIEHFHDLRRPAATRLYRANLTVREIATMMGWSEDYVDAIIVRYVQRDEVSIDLAKRMQNAAGTVLEKI